jgi:membrane-bound lytic murein transglycosylase D
MTLYFKPSLILTSVAISAQLLFSTYLRAQSVESDAPDEEQVVAAADSLAAEMERTALSYGDGFIPYISEELIADRISCLQNEYNRTIQSFIEFFVVRKRDYTKMVLGRTDLYFPIFEHYLKKYNLPPELKYLSVVESGLNPRIISPAKAGGLWQFMPGTGRDFRLYQDTYVDERFDPYKSTEAACKYLKQLYNLFGDWELALASYNCGPGNVRRAIRRSGNRTNFWEIYNNLPRETRSYVPQFVALTYVLNYADDYQLRADSLEKIIPFDTVQVSQYVNMEALAKHIDTPLEDLRHLNPHLKRNVVPQYLKNYPIRIPSDRYEHFKSNRLAILDSVSKAEHPEAKFLMVDHGFDIQRIKIYHKVRKGESLARIASKYDVPASKIAKWNHLRANRVNSGQRLTIFVEKRVPVYHKPAANVSESAVASQKDQDSGAVSAAATTSAPVAATNAAAPVEKKIKVQEKIVHTVRRGESLARIAEKYHVTIDQLKEWNDMKSNTAQLGRKLTIVIEQEIAVEKPVATLAKADTAKQPKTTETAQASMPVPSPGPVEEKQTSAPVEDKIFHTVKKGEGLFKIAGIHHVSVNEIKEWNNLNDSNLYPGQQLVIWKANAPVSTEASKDANESSTSVTISASDASALAAQSSGSHSKESHPSIDKEKQAKTSVVPRYHRVQKGDTLWSISRQYGDIPVEKLKKLNKLKSNELKAGQKLILG